MRRHFFGVLPNSVESHRSRGAVSEAANRPCQVTRLPWRGHHDQALESLRHYLEHPFSVQSIPVHIRCSTTDTAHEVAGSLLNIR